MYSLQSFIEWRPHGFHTSLGQGRVQDLGSGVWGFSVRVGGVGLGASGPGPPQKQRLKTHVGMARCAGSTHNSRPCHVASICPTSPCKGTARAVSGFRVQHLEWKPW